jgi:hypothetical protein
MTWLDISKNALGAPGFKHLSEGIKGCKGLTELNVSDNDATNTMDQTGNTDMSGVVDFALAISNMGALSSVNILKNKIGTDHAKALVSILKGHPTLKSLCGNKGDETELNMSGKVNGADDASMLAAEIFDNRALTSLDMGYNRTIPSDLHQQILQKVARNRLMPLEAEEKHNQVCLHVLSACRSNMTDPLYIRQSSLKTSTLLQMQRPNGGGLKLWS